MPWEKSSLELISLFQQLVPEGQNIERRKMFGCHCAFVNGNLFSGLFQQGMTFRLPPADLTAFLDQPDAAPFEPMPGRRMTGYVIHHAPLAAGEENLANWIRCSLDFASKLPPKKKVAAKKAPAAKKAKKPARKRA
jgi:TfoX/Sxy family transcriptional regulator of competence genes